MKSLEVNIEVSIIDWVISQNNISNNIKELLQEVKNNKLKITFKQLEDISKKINIPLGYFFLKQPPQENLNIIECRTIDSIELENPSRDLVDTIYEMQNIQDWMRDYLISNEFDKIDFIGSQKNQDDYNIIANSIREKLNIKMDWFLKCKNSSDLFKKLRFLLNEVGVLVMINGIVGSNNKRKLNLNEFRAFTLIDDFAPLIFINNNDSENGKIFSLLHETVHIWLGIDSFYNDRYNDNINVSDKENMCNKVAAEILVPKQMFLKLWHSNNSNDLIETCNKLSKIFKCSKVVIARRALDNEFINQLEYDLIVKKTIEDYNLNKKNKSSGGDYYNTMLTRLDNNFIKALYCSVKEGKTQFTEAYRLTNTNRITFDKLAEKVGGVKY